MALELRVAVFLIGAYIGREKLVDRESDAAEEFAGRILGGSHALFVRQTEIMAGNDQLGVALQADDGELSQTNIDALFIVLQDQVIIKAIANALGNLEQIAVAADALRVTGFNQLDTEADGVDHLNGRVQLGRCFGAANPSRVALSERYA
jgi:hypothetical protein